MAQVVAIDTIGALCIDMDIGIGMDMDTGTEAQGMGMDIDIDMDMDTGFGTGTGAVTGAGDAVAVERGCDTPATAAAAAAVAAARSTAGTGAGLVFCLVGFCFAASRSFGMDLSSPESVCELRIAAALSGGCCGVWICGMTADGVCGWDGVLKVSDVKGG